MNKSSSILLGRLFAPLQRGWGEDKSNFLEEELQFILERKWKCKKKRERGEAPQKSWTAGGGGGKSLMENRDMGKVRLGGAQKG
jgi:hypothetical protein